jgi:hypothetical protein
MLVSDPEHLRLTVPTRWRSPGFRPSLQVRRADRENPVAPRPLSARAVKIGPGTGEGQGSPFVPMLTQTSRFFDQRGYTNSTPSRGLALSWVSSTCQ